MALRLLLSAALAAVAVQPIAGCSSKSSVRGLASGDASPEAGTGGNVGSAATGGNSAGGSDGGAAGGSAGAPAELDCNALARAQCDRLQDCAPLSVELAHGSVAGCVAQTAASCSASRTAPGTDPTSGAGCAAVLPSVTCNALLDGNLPAECQFTGSLSAGSSCKFFTQCASGYCHFSTNIACGTCREPAAEGASCLNTRCASGLHCNYSINVCVRTGAAGTACDASSPLACQSPLACVNGICSEPLPAGSVCDPAASGCDRLAFCLPNAAGENRCQTLVVAAAGDDCGFVNATFVQCRIDAWCDATTNHCVARPGLGAACDSTGVPPCEAPLECSNGACSVPDANQCS